LILSGQGTGNLNLSADYQQYMISSALIVTAIGSAIQITAFRYRGFQLGTGLLSVVGTTFTIIPLAQSVFAVSNNFRGIFFFFGGPPPISSVYH
jgi:uric acid-xanthine permease